MKQHLGTHQFEFSTEPVGDGSEFPQNQVLEDQTHPRKSHWTYCKIYNEKKLSLKVFQWHKQEHIRSPLEGQDSHSKSR